MASLKRRPGLKGYWQLQWYENGKQKRKSLGKASLNQRTKALNEANKLEQAARYGIAPQVSVITPAVRGRFFGHYAKDYQHDFRLEYPRSARKCDGHMIHLIKHFGDLRLVADVTSEQMWCDAWDSYKRYRLGVDRVSASTLHGEWETLRSSLNRAVPKLMRYNPMQQAKFGPKVPKPHIHVFEPHELAAIDAVDPVFAAVWRWGANTGMRRGELEVLRRKLIGRDEVAILNDPKAGVETKSGVSRIVPLSDDAQDARDRIIFENQETNLFLNPVSRGVWSKRFLRARIKAGVERGTLHGLRHFFISHLVNELREPLPVVQELAGHSKIETTMKYIRVLPDHHKRAIANFKSVYAN
jgi:integrase